jgi:hypothetical protein
MEIVSGRIGKPHVTSQQFRQLIEGTVGQESCILTSGENLEPELASNNSLKIRSGMLAHHGNISSVKIGTYDAVNLSNGSQGMKRIDLVVCRYTRNAETEVESCNWVVIMGTPVSSNPVAPTYTVGNLQEGDLVDDCPVFEVHYDGINVTEVRKILSVAPNLTELNSKIITTDSGTCIKHANGFMEQFIKAKVLTKTFSAWGSCYYASVPAVDYIEPFKTVIDSDVRIEADGQAWTMGIDNGTLKQSPSVYAMRPNSPGGQLLVTVRVHAKGTWK